MTSGVLLSVQHLSVRFGGLFAVSDVSFDVHRNEVFTLIGPNGAGKTTILNLISRICQPTTGEIHFDGHCITRMKADEIARTGIARTFQNIELFEQATVLQNLLIGRHTRSHGNFWQHLFFTPSVWDEERAAREKVEEVIDLLDLQHYRDSVIAGLPYGIRKVVELARALCVEPKLLLLDEPSSGLNTEETSDMAYWIDDIRDDLGIPILMVEHDMSLVSRVSDRVMAMNHGEVVAVGTPAEVKAHPGVIEAYLGKDQDVSRLRRHKT
jgi:branched-chain amino acid transport system ATP-binding protein